MSTKKTLSVLLIKDSCGWVAQCLEYDIAGQGKSMDDARYEFERTFVTQIALNLEEGKDAFAIPAAPKRLQQLFKDAEVLGDHRPNKYRVPLPPELRKSIPEFKMARI